MPMIRVIKTTADRIMIQHVANEHYDDANLPLPKQEVAAQVLATHEMIAAAGVTDSAQIDIVAGQLVLDPTKTAYATAVTSARQAALDKLATLATDAAVPDAIKAYLEALAVLARCAPASADPSYTPHGDGS